MSRSINRASWGPSGWTRAVPLVVLTWLGLVQAADKDGMTFPKPTLQQTVGLLPIDGDVWCKITIITRADGKRRRGVAQQHGGALALKKSSKAKAATAYGLQQIGSLELGSHKVGALAAKAIKNNDFHRALKLIPKAFSGNQDPAAEPYLQYLKLQASMGMRRVDARLDRLASTAGNAEMFQETLATLLDDMGRSRLPPRAKTIVEDAWYKHAEHLDAAQREVWKETAKRMRMHLRWDDNVPVYLTEAREGYGKQEWALAADRFGRAIDGRAAYTEADQLKHALALLKAEKHSEAAKAWWSLPASLRQDGTAASLFRKAGHTAPPLKPKLLTLAYLGGEGDQAFHDVKIDAGGGVTASNSAGLRITFAADGVTVASRSGNPDMNCELTARDRRAQAKGTATHGGRIWTFGSKAINGGLQQPFLNSPYDWHWWGWSDSQCQSAKLTVPGGVEAMLFPNAKHFAVWSHAGGAKASINADPRDLDEDNEWVKGRYTGGSIIMLGEQQSGEPVRGWSFSYKPFGWTKDRYGNIFVGGEPGTVDTQEHFHRDGPAVLICGSDLEQRALLRFSHGTFTDMAIGKGKLALIGYIGHPARTDARGRKQSAEDPGKLKVVNPLQPKPGGDVDALIAIVQLY